MSLLKIFPSLTQLLFSIWAYVLGVFGPIAASLNISTAPAELPIFTRSSSHHLLAVHIHGSSKNAPPSLDGDQPAHRIFVEPPTLVINHQNICNKCQSATTPAAKKKQKRKAHVLFPPAIKPVYGLHDDSAVIDTTRCAIDTSTITYQSPSSTPSDCESPLSTMSEEKFSGVFSPTSPSSTSSTPFSSPPTTPELPCLPIDVAVVVTPDEDVYLNHIDDTAPDNIAQDTISAQEIGELGKRRGFKGSPLFTAETSKKSTFLQVPSGFSPRTPRNPLGSMTNLMKVASSPKTEKQRAADAKQAPLALQEDFDFNDPFRTTSDSYYIPEVVNNTISYANLDNFTPYQDAVLAKTPSLKRKPAMSDLHSPPRNQATLSHFGLTNIYDVSIYQYNGSPTKSKSVQSKSNSRSHTTRPRESTEVKPILSSSPSSPRSEFSSVDQVYVPHTEDTEDYYDIIAIAAEYACHIEDSPQLTMEDTLPDSPIPNIIPRDEYSGAVLACQADDFKLEAAIHTEVTEQLRDITTTNIEDIDTAANQNAASTQKRNTEITNNSIHGEAIEPSKRNDLTYVKNLTSTPTVTSFIRRDNWRRFMYTGYDECPAYDHSPCSSLKVVRPQQHLLADKIYNRTSPQPTYMGPQAPKRSASLRPLFLPQKVARQRPNSEAFGTRYSCPAAFVPLPPPPPRATSALQPLTKSDTTPSSCTRPPRPHSLPLSLLYEPRPHPHSAGTWVETPSTTTRDSLPKRRSKALDDILNLLEAADFNDKQAADSSSNSIKERDRYDDAQQREEVHGIEDKRWDEVHIAAYAI